MKKICVFSRKIAIIGGGFSGTSLAAMLYQLSHVPIHITLCDKSGTFGAGDAYKTPFGFHLLNVKAKDMSVFEDNPTHFISWLKDNKKAIQDYKLAAPLGEQFVPRRLYHDYLQAILKAIQKPNQVRAEVKLAPSAVVDLSLENHQINVIFSDGKKIVVDQVILALGNNAPAMFPFPVEGKNNLIANPWDYEAPTAIKKDETVLLVGTGLSMIDTVLTLYHQHHEGTIYAVSRHGLLPLKHSDLVHPFSLDLTHLPNKIRALTRYLRQESEKLIQEGGDWRMLIGTFRSFIPSVWQSLPLEDKKRFLRHLSTYWSIHRHRVPAKVLQLLESLMKSNQLKLIAGRVKKVEDGMAFIQSRAHHAPSQYRIDWVINCLGPALSMNDKDPLIRSLYQQGMLTFDSLKMGFNIEKNGALIQSSGKPSPLLFTLGSPARGVYWETSAVPEIRKQSYALAKHLLSET